MRATPSKQSEQRNLCFVDTETTGTLIGYHEIIEVAVVRTDYTGETEIARWSARCRPTFPERATDGAKKLTGFSETAWHNAPQGSPAIWQDFSRVTAGSICVCHNPSFDRAFISLAARAVGVDELLMDYHWIGTESLAWPLFQSGILDSLRQRDIARALGVSEEPAIHEAIEGALLCKRIHSALMRRYWALLSHY